MYMDDTSAGIHPYPRHTTLGMSTTREVTVNKNMGWRKMAH